MMNNEYEMEPQDSAGDEVGEDTDGSGMEYVGWPGDGSGEDDLADFNANEVSDYQNEDVEDNYYDHDTPLSDELGGE